MTLSKDIYVLYELGEDSQATFGRFVEKNIGALWITHSAHAYLTGFDTGTRIRLRA